MPYVASTLASDQNYTAWDKAIPAGAKVSRPAIPLKSVLVNGGANVANKITTPQGVITKISDDDAEFLKSHRAFKEHEARGHVKIIARDADPDKVARDLKIDNGEIKNGKRISGGSSQLNEAHGDFKEGGRAAGLAPGTKKII